MTARRHDDTVTTHSRLNRIVSAFCPSDMSSAAVCLTGTLKLQDCSLQDFARYKLHVSTASTYATEAYTHILYYCS